MSGVVDDVRLIDEARARLGALDEERAGLVEKQKRYESKLFGLNQRVRGAGVLPTQEYRRICKEQTWLKQALVDIQSKLCSLKAQRIKESRMENELSRGLRSPTPAVLVDEVVLGAVQRLRDHYLAFSHDATRVNSMRLMASEFADALTKVLALRPPVKRVGELA